MLVEPSLRTLGHPERPRREGHLHRHVSRPQALCYVPSLSLCVNVQVHFTLAQCTPGFSTCRRHTNVSASVQVAPENRLPFDKVAERR